MVIDSWWFNGEVINGDVYGYPSANGMCVVGKPSLVWECYTAPRFEKFVFGCIVFQSLSNFNKMMITI